LRPHIDSNAEHLQEVLARFKLFERLRTYLWFNSVDMFDFFFDSLTDEASSFFRLMALAWRLRKILSAGVGQLSEDLRTRLFLSIGVRARQLARAPERILRKNILKR
jgi:hypothetical protein